MCSVDDKVIEARVKEKEEAKEIFNDAISAGNTAVFAETKDTKRGDVVNLTIGNLLPE